MSRPTASYSGAHWTEQICQTCRHVGKEHEAGECWVEIDGKQCPCGWMDLIDPPIPESDDE